MDDLCLYETWSLKDSDVCLHVCRPYQLLVVNSKGKPSDTKEWVCEVLKYRGDRTLLNEFEQWNVPRFPLNGYMLNEKGVPGKITGIELGHAVMHLKL
jgi:tRNA nucleotidyltransferase (CCA-adding enzyme)